MNTSDDSAGKILLGSGSILDLRNPHLCNIDIIDIAYGLAYSCRFSGQCRDPQTGARLYHSVAEHCVRMSYIVPKKLIYSALMHEVGEAFCGDVPGPLKQICHNYRDIEKAVEAAVKRKFHVDDVDVSAIKFYDHVMLATEVRDLMPPSSYPWPIKPEVVPLAEKIIPWPSDKAALRFICRYQEARCQKPV